MTTCFCIVLLLLQASTIKCYAEFNLIDRIRATVTTSQSSTFSSNNNPQDFNSTKAIDGVQNYSIDICKCCSVTNGDTPSWWQIDLGQKYLLGGLQIFGRSANERTQLEHAEVYASNVSMKPGIASNRMKVYDVPSMEATTRNFTEQLVAIIAQYFLVELNKKVLTLCEFKLIEKECKVGYFGSGCLHSCHCSDNNRCDQVTGKCQTPGCLAGWKGEACAEDSNLIERIQANVTTSQSSIYAPYLNPQDFNSSKAIDGVKNYSVDTCKCCSVTDGNSPSWWQIDLGQKYLLGGLHIFGRAINYNWQLESASIYAGNVSMRPGIASNKMKIYNVPSMDASTRNFTKQFDAIIAQYFLVELSQRVLILCEFKLYEKECDIGYFGSGCLHSCHCSDTNRCDQVTGKCQTPGCLAGWTGEACEDACGHRRFGQDCTSVCHCLYNTSCNTISGECHNGLCDPGWQTPSCITDCGHRRFGQNCTSVCHCFNNASCNSISGECHNGKCNPGWQTPSCDKACDFHTFGFNCSSTCHCLNNTNCNSTTGECGIGMCDPGWQGSSCDQACDHRSFGLNCSSICHCLNNTACNGTTGNCVLSLCDSGWQGPRCDQVCDHRSFGYNCSSTCHCLNNTNCNSTTGTCITGLCDPGWQGPRCDRVCDFHTFGFNCSSTCHCLNNTNCNSTTGECGIGMCDPGWQGSSCDQVCDHRSFGFNCSSTCHCLNNTTCNGTTGNCVLSLCDSGWQSPRCDQVCDHRLFGYNCSSTCHCLNNTNCNSTTGTCNTGLCDPGWQGPTCDQACDYRAFGYNCSSTCHCLNNTDCNSSTGRCYIELCDFGWQGPRCDEEQNIVRRLNMQTDMSSTFLNWTSNLAIDGNIGPKPDVCNCCSGTKNSPISWWTVDLGKRYPINSVTVFSRQFDQLYQQLADFELYLANDTGKNSFHLVKNSTRRIDGNKHVLTFSNKLTRFIKIQRPGVLTLCEVMVSEGECQVGTFGEECSEICHCADDLSCDKTSGHCQSDACKSGWIGTSCNQECPKNRFGDKCSETCFCAEGTCTSNYGVCQNGCQQGYTGSHCNQVGDFNNHTRPANAEKNSAALIAVVVGGSIAGLIICVLVGVVVVKLRRKRSEGNKSHYSTPNSQANQSDQDYDTLDIFNDNQGRRNTTYENEVVSNM